LPIKITLFTEPAMTTSNRHAPDAA
jgi:hypothetical protein